MLEFGKDISWVALVIMVLFSDLHPGWKLMLQLFQAKWPKYPERLFSSVTKSNIEM